MRKFAIAAVLAGAIASLCGGCTARERAGYSSIPQNSPGSWEMRPYGSMAN